MNTSEIIGLGAAIVVLAGLSVAIIYGKNTAAVITAAGNAFTGSIRAATLQPGGGRSLAR
jgi:hypothetical protein